MFETARAGRADFDEGTEFSAETLDEVFTGRKIVIHSCNGGRRNEIPVESFYKVKL